MNFKASKFPTVVVFDVSFSYPIVSVGRSISFKRNQMSPVVMLVHVAKLSEYKVGLHMLIEERSYAVVESLIDGCSPTSGDLDCHLQRELA